MFRELKTLYSYIFVGYVSLVRKFQTKNEVVKKTVYDELVKKVNAIQTTDTSNLVKKKNK